MSAQLHARLDAGPSPQARGVREGRLRAVRVRGTIPRACGDGPSKINPEVLPDSPAYATQLRPTAARIGVGLAVMVTVRKETSTHLPNWSRYDWPHCEVTVRTP